MVKKAINGDKNNQFYYLQKNLQKYVLSQYR